jgi:aspartate/methionine/tyrosine aminotransferase
MLAAAYLAMTGFLDSYAIPYVPANAGLYVFAKLAPDARTWEDEIEMVEHLKSAGVVVSPGKAYHVPESQKGWARVLFALEEEQLGEAIRRMKTVYEERNNLPESIGSGASLFTKSGDCLRAMCEYIWNLKINGCN